MAENDIYSSYTGASPDIDWSQAYVAAPRFFTRPDGRLFGIETILPKLPQNRYHPNGHDVGEWRILLYSKTKGDVIGDTDFFAAMRRLGIGGYILDENETHFLIRGLSLTELDALMRG